ncbi:hypothetical protein A1O3_04032 [Capronia epimyces CBS 606.96]|uniref:Uncharacterized protein n=1 Tax=Capronia epimyces CBS 606.96 TaxID=1182542 RepID=W9YXQ1_9EURO|nr:uncharacterized protein A1O3_04032 [Capronia epimyces CBS 606.96]EXJ87074.1 hypothetical protein A1O3_04032 [Capronia epimyces CBS 606.96]
MASDIEETERLCQLPGQECQTNRRDTRLRHQATIKGNGSTSVANFASQYSDEKDDVPTKRRNGDHDSDKDYEEECSDTRSAEAQNDNLTLKNKRRNLPASLETARKRVRSLEENLDESNREKEALRVQVQNLNSHLKSERGKNENLNSQLKKAREKNENLNSQLKKAKEKNENLNSQLKKAREKIDTLEGNLREICSEKLDLVGADDNDMKVIPDDVVSSDLDRIFQETRLFSYKWSFKAWREASEQQHQKAVTYLTANSAQPFASERCVQAVEQKEIRPKTIVHALVNQFVCENTFQRPFANLKGLLANGSTMNVEKAMGSFIRLAELGSMESSNLARVSILRALEPPRVSGPEQLAQSELFQHRKQVREKHCQTTCDRFFPTYGALLKPVDEQDRQTRRAEFLQLVTDAFELSSQLALHHPVVQAFFLNEMPDPLFEVKHEHFDPHRGMKLKEDDDDDDGRDPKLIGIDGQAIDLVIEPMVRRCGDNSGRHYDRIKVLHKGVVWVVADEDLGLTTQEIPKQSEPVPTAAPARAHATSATEQPPDSSPAQHQARLLDPFIQSPSTNVRPATPGVPAQKENHMSLICAPDLNFKPGRSRLSPLESQAEAKRERCAIKSENMNGEGPSISPSPSSWTHDSAPTTHPPSSPSLVLPYWMGEVDKSFEGLEKRKGLGIQEECPEQQKGEMSKSFTWPPTQHSEKKRKNKGSGPEEPPPKDDAGSEPSTRKKAVSMLSHGPQGGFEF